MSEERIFNIFVYFNKGIANEIGARFHKASGTVEEKTALLKEKMPDDHKIAVRVTLPRSFTPEQWRALLRKGGQHDFFEPLFSKMRANREPFCCLTPVVDGVPTWDQEIDSGPFRGDAVTGFGMEGIMKDYLVEYTKGNTFDLSRLIDDDFFAAIRLLFTNRLYVSSSKLLMSCIDTIAFIEYGDIPGNFNKWLDSYCDLSPLGVTSSEVWSFRSSLVHMTNLESRSVLQGRTSKISPFFAPIGTAPPVKQGGIKPFNFTELIHVVAGGIFKWGESLNADPDKMINFIERYDTLISDSRYAEIVRIKNNAG